MGLVRFVLSLVVLTLGVFGSVVAAQLDWAILEKNGDWSVLLATDPTTGESFCAVRNQQSSVEVIIAIKPDRSVDFWFKADSFKSRSEQIQFEITVDGGGAWQFSGWSKENSFVHNSSDVSKNILILEELMAGTSAVVTVRNSQFSSNFSLSGTRKSVSKAIQCSGGGLSSSHSGSSIKSAFECHYLENVDWDNPESPMAYIQTDGGKIWLYPAFEDYMFMLQDIEEATGVGAGKSGYPLNGNVGYNALAILCDGDPRIIYDRGLSPALGYVGAEDVDFRVGLTHFSIWC
jgi:hypothetical protein